MVCCRTLYRYICFNQDIKPEMMKQFAAIMLLALGISSQAGAQTFLDGLTKSKPGQGTVTVTQSQDIDELVNNTRLVRTQPAPAASQPARTERPAAERKTTVTHSGSAEKAHTESAARTERESETSTTTSEDWPTVNTSKKVMRHARKVTGYRVQAYSGGNSRADRQRAQNIGDAIKSRFPDLPIYVHFYSPRWICRVGNFRTYDEANEVLKVIKDMGYSQACIVKGKITVAY